MNVSLPAALALALPECCGDAAVALLAALAVALPVVLLLARGAAIGAAAGATAAQWRCR